LKKTGGGERLDKWDKKKDSKKIPSVAGSKILVKSRSDENAGYKVQSQKKKTTGDHGRFGQESNKT